MRGSRYEEAAALLARVHPGDEYPHPAEALWALERGRVNEALGRREAALQAYQSVVEMWRGADRELQPYVHQARDRLSRLVSEPRR